MEPGVPTDPILAARADRIAEAKGIIDAARSRGLVLRLIGGLAVRFHCDSLDFCERKNGDIDLVGHRDDANRLASLFADLGFEEIVHVRQATGGRQLQFALEGRQRVEQARRETPAYDHVDVFLDTFKMDHAIDLTERLHFGDYTVTVSDILLTKLQMAHLNEKDERDIFTLLQDLELGTAEDPGTIDVAYIARLCASDWGLFHDVELNLGLLRERLDAYPLPPGGGARARANLTRLQEAIEAHPKSWIWRLRAKIGERHSWRNQVEEQG